MYKRILVPVDGSVTSKLGLAHAAGLAKPLGAAIRLINVVDELSVVPAVDAAALVELPTLIAGLKEAGQKVLEESARFAASQGVAQAQAVLLESHGAQVSHVIVEDAKKWGADLICIGTHGRRGLNRLLLGSDAERVLRAATVPVLLVRGRDDTGK
jgi:nucleotide-binding universal stress UspA family protein